MVNYELICIINPELANEELTKSINKVTELINKVGGNVIDVVQWGRRKLAYPINRFHEGTYVLAKLEMKPTTTNDFEASMKLSNEIVRHLLIRL